jgi:hypothetical protein
LPVPVNKHKAAKRFELDIAEDLGARRVFLSGAGMEKADVRKKTRYRYLVSEGIAVPMPTLTFRVEAKTTKNEYFPFRTVDWLDLRRVADASAEMPVFAVRFLGQHGDIAIIRSGMAFELGFRVHDLNVVKLKKSTMLRPRDHVCVEIAIMRGSVLHETENLVTLPYVDFIEKVRKHADFE